MTGFVFLQDTILHCPALSDTRWYTKLRHSKMIKDLRHSKEKNHKYCIQYTVQCTEPAMVGPAAYVWFLCQIYCTLYSTVYVIKNRTYTALLPLLMFRICLAQCACSCTACSTYVHAVVYVSQAAQFRSSFFINLSTINFIYFRVRPCVSTCDEHDDSFFIQPIKKIPSSSPVRDSETISPYLP